MDEYVPTTWDEIATGFGEYAEQLCRGGKWREEGYSADFEQHSGYLAAQAWLAAHDAAVKAGALREFRVGFGRRFGFQDPYGHFDSGTLSALHRQVEALLDAEALRIEKGEA